MQVVIAESPIQEAPVLVDYTDEQLQGEEDEVMEENIQHIRKEGDL